MEEKTEIKRETKKIDLTVGSIPKRVLGFVVPTLIMMLIQSVYSITDMAIVGHYIGSAGMSAANMGGMVVTVVLNFAMGLTNGGNIYIGQLVGARKTDNLNRIIGSMLTFFTIFALVMTAVLLIFGRPILLALGTPEEAREFAVTYLYICAAGTLFVYTYNAFACAYRGLGRPVPVMIFVIISVLLNVALDWILVGPLNMGITGAAIATIFSQFVCLVVCMIHAKKTYLFDFKRESFKIHPESLKIVIKIGFPQALQFFITQTSFLLINGFVNQYGVFASALAGATTKVTMFATTGTHAFQACMISFTAQNSAAKQYSRVIRGMIFSMLLSLIWAGLFFAAAMITPEGMLSVFTSDAGVINFRPEYLQVMLIGSVIESLMFCLYGVIAGSGHTFYMFFCAVVSAIIIRFPLVWIFTTYTSMGFMGIAWAYVCAPIASGLVALIYILSGKWKKSRVLSGRQKPENA